MTERFPSLREQLDEIQALRHSYEGELSDSQTVAQPLVSDSVFVSSTSADLKPHRQAARDVIENLHLKFIGMEELAPTAQAPVDLIRRKVNEAAGVSWHFGDAVRVRRSGHRPSMTELEYRQAIASDKRICMFVMEQAASILEAWWRTIQLGSRGSLILEAAL